MLLDSATVAETRDQGLGVCVERTKEEEVRFVTRELDYLNETDLVAIESDIDNVGRMLNGLITSLRLKRRLRKP